MCILTIGTAAQHSLMTWHSKGFGACGTLRLNRKGLPQIIKSKRKMKMHTMVSGTTGKSLAMVWMDKRAVAMLSTIHDDSMVPIS